MTGLIDGLLPLYLRRELTTDRVLLERCPRQAAKTYDVVAYRDPALTTVAVRWGWWQKPPRKGRKRVTFNCYQWRAIWVD